MKLFALCLMMLFCGVVSGMDSGNNCQGSSASSAQNTGRVRRLALSGLPRTSNVIPAATSYDPSSLPALVLPGQAVAAAAASSVSLPTKPAPTLDELNIAFYRARNANDVIELIKQGASFAHGVQRMCKSGNAVELKKVLAFDKKSSIEIKSQAIAPSGDPRLQALYAVPAWDSNPLAAVFVDQNNPEQRMEMLKVLCADSRSRVESILRYLYRNDNNIDAVKLILFMMQGNDENVHWSIFPDVEGSNLEQLHSSRSNMQELSTHYSPAELKEYRQLLFDREGVTPEHLIKAVKGRHEYMVKRILYKATDDFLNVLETPSLQPGMQAQSPVQYAYNYTQLNDHNEMGRLIAHYKNMHQCITKEEHNEFCENKGKQVLGNQNTLMWLLNREMGPQFVVHQKFVTRQKMLAPQRAAALQHERKKDSLIRINDQSEQPNKKLNSANREYFRPIEDDCTCMTCKNYTVAYLHHLFKAHEMTGYTLASIHNLHYMVQLMADYRRRIMEGEL